MSLPHRLFVAAFLVAVVNSAPASAAGHAVTFRADDGRTVSAWMVEANQRPAPAVVLVPMLGRGKDDWLAAADRLAEANITALAIELPGSSAPPDARDLAGWSTVVHGAVSFLSSRPDVRPGSIAVAGASLGATLAALAAAADSRIRSLALISPSLEYRGVHIETAMKQYGERPALLMASVHDPYAARSVRELATAAPGLREMQWSETVAHGTVLIAREPDLIRSLVEWFRRTLGVN